MSISNIFQSCPKCKSLSELRIALNVSYPNVSPIESHQMHPIQIQGGLNSKQKVEESVQM